MQILASALPGFRDLRAPLTAGYLWLVLLWIWLKPDLATRPKNEIAGAVYDLGKAVGPIWIGLGVSVAAYLMGSISQLFSEPLNRTAALAIQLLQLPSALAGYGGQDRAFLDSIKRQRDRGLQKLGNPSFEGKVNEMNRRQHDEYQKLLEQFESAERSRQMELNLPATLLVGKEPELFTETDRLKAEAQLRLSIVPPLIAIIAYIAIEDSWWWIFMALPVSILWFQGHRRNLEFKSLMISAFQQGLVRSQTLENLKEWVDNLPTIRNDGGSTTIREANRDGAS